MEPSCFVRVARCVFETFVWSVTCSGPPVLGVAQHFCIPFLSVAHHNDLHMAGDSVSSVFHQPRYDGPQDVHTLCTGLPT
eukprot:289347-Amphidinium_carterae.1